MTTTGYAGHFLPLVPLARACIRAGHEVRVTAPRAHGGLIEQMGLDLHACADPADEDIARLLTKAAELSQREGHTHMMSEGFARVATLTVLRDVMDAVDTWRPDAVVRECQEYAGALAAECSGLPHLRVALGLAAQEEETLSVVAGVVDELRGDLGLPGDPDARALRESPYLTPIPPLLEEPGGVEPAATQRFRDRRNGAPPGQKLPDWVDGAADPLVYLTFGSVAGALGLFPRLYRAAIEALAEVPANVLVSVGENADPGDLGALPSNVHVERWVDQEAILDRAAALVCHGGYGSVLGALASGTPIVALPVFADDQWRNAARVAELGAGLALGGDRGRERRMLDGPDAETFAQLPAAVDAVIADPSYSRAARRVASAIEALPPVDAAVTLLEGLVASDRPRSAQYVLGNTPAEYERLRMQARMWEPDTTRLFDRVGLGEGDRCLDVGCGPGETMRLMAERVGVAGEVVGVDADATIGNQAVAMLRAVGHTQCRFEPGDIEAGAATSGAPFDLVYARLLLTHVTDPAAVLGRLWECVAPGGHLVVQDYDLPSSAVVPELDSAEEFYRLSTEVFHRAGRDIRVGLRLPALHVTAGLGAPDGIETAVRCAPLDQLAPMYEAVYRSLLPTAQAFGLTTEADAERWFQAFARDTASGGGHVALWPLLVGTWKRKPAAN